MSTERPPEIVLHEFLRVLSAITVWDTDEEDSYADRFVPVLRGSVLLRHWFGDRARPAADIDLECFEGPLPEPEDDRAREYRRQGYGPWGEYETLVDYGKAMCRYAAEYSRYYRWREDLPPAIVEFEETEPPEGGHSLWVYGTPGERYYAGWRLNEPPRTNGILQIDVAEPGGYGIDPAPTRRTPGTALPGMEDPHDRPDVPVIDTELVELRVGDDQTFTIRGYTRETMLAAKVSWLLRSFTRRSEGDHLLPPEWTGEPKDLFDVHLLVGESLRAEPFQRALVAVAPDDGLDWRNVETLFDVRRTDLDDDAFDNWDEFVEDCGTTVPCGPAEMLRRIVDGLEPLWGDFHRPAENGFLRTINDDPADEVPYVVYADWLEERGDPRATFLRQLAEYLFHRDEMSADDAEAARTAVGAAMAETSQPWLCRLFGTSDRLVNARLVLGG